MTLDELLALPVSVDIVTAGRAFSIGRWAAYELARTNSFPCRVIRVGKRYRVPRSAIFDTLGIEPAVDAGRELLDSLAAASHANRAPTAVEQTLQA